MRFLAKFAAIFPLASDHSHFCFLLTLLLQLLLMLLLSRSAHGHAVRLKSPSRYARRGCLRLYSHRGASAADTPPSFRRDTTLPACSCAFIIGEFRRWWYSSPPCSTSGGWQLIPTGPPLCLGLDASLDLNQLMESKALFQYPRT